jgi:uncharacterized membrane protein
MAGTRNIGFANIFRYVSIILIIVLVTPTIKDAMWTAYLKTKDWYFVIMRTITGLLMIRKQ